MPKKLSRSLAPRRKLDAVPIGSSWVNRSDLKGLQIAWKHQQLVLFLGAGVSLAYGIPAWKNLVLEMLFDQTEHARRLKGLLPHYRRAIASWLADYFEYNPVILARIIEDNLRKRKGSGKAGRQDPFLLNIHQHLYAAYKPTTRGSALTAIADFIQKSNGNIPAIVNFNFDNLLEEQLQQRRVDHISVVTDKRRAHGRLPIIHPHGFIPRTGDLSDTQVIFTERHYHALTETIFHWALTEIVSHLRHHTVLFIGLSMSDPSLRRLLDACRNSDIPPHWQVQKRHEIRDHERFEAAQDIDRRARDWGELLERPEQKTPHDLLDIIDSALRQADTYDRQLFEQMGVKTVWLNDFDDIPRLLEAIPQPERSKIRGRGNGGNRPVRRLAADSGKRPRIATHR
jgi:SIR2-like protein